MKKHFLLPIFFILLVTTLSGCEIIGDIFEAGVWVGVLVVVAIIGVIIWLIGRARK